MDVVFSHLSDIGSALVTTLELAVLSFAFALVIGILVAIMRISPVAPLRWAGTVYVEFFRNVPLLSLLFVVVFGLPDLGVTFSLFASVVIGIALSSAAFVCEAVRSGINTVPIGQAEAARAIGLTFGQSLRNVILPQALRSMIQPLTNVWIGTLIGTSIAANVGVFELTQETHVLNNEFAGGLALYGIIALIYVVLCLLSGAAGGLIERRLAVSR